MNPKHKKHKENCGRHTATGLLKAADREKNLQSSQWRENSYREIQFMYHLYCTGSWWWMIVNQAAEKQSYYFHSFKVACSKKEECILDNG